jgi:enoyl-CoA hydratase/carnithine racemase
MLKSSRTCGNTSSRNDITSDAVIFKPMLSLSFACLYPWTDRGKEGKMSILERNDENAVAHLRMTAPERLNALSDEMIAALQAQFDSLKEDRSVRAVVLSGAGKAFCAGHDLKQMTAGRQAEDGGKAYFKDLFDRCARMMQTIQTLPQPVIAKVHGIATAAGCQLVATCDLAVADTETRFGVNGVNIGLFCSTPMVALSRNIPRKKAFEMLTTGRFIQAAEAERLGLINQAVPPEDLDSAAETLARTLADKLGAAVSIGKQAFYEQIQMPLDKAYAYTGEVMVENMLYRDTEEGIAAFIDKRPPDWQQ